MKEKGFLFNKILVVDDSEVDFFIVNTMIKRKFPSTAIFFAMDVDSGIKMLKSFAPSEMPDLILLDLFFKNHYKQGADFLSEFAKINFGIIANTKIKVLTAYADYRDAKGLHHKFPNTEILEKPFSLEKLMDMEYVQQA